MWTGTFSQEAKVARIKYVQSIVWVREYHGVLIAALLGPSQIDSVPPVFDTKPKGHACSHAHQYLADMVQLFELCDNCEMAGVCL